MLYFISGAALIIIGGILYSVGNRYEEVSFRDKRSGKLYH